MKVEASLYQLELGEKILKGDWWQDWSGEFTQRDSVRWREKVTKRHAPHFRLFHLKQTDFEGRNTHERNS